MKATSELSMSALRRTIWPTGAAFRDTNAHLAIWINAQIIHTPPNRAANVGVLPQIDKCNLTKQYKTRTFILQFDGYKIL